MLNERMKCMAVLGICALLSIQAAAVENGNITDKDITLAIKNELLVDEEVSSHLIDVETDDGIVTLSGSVNNVLAGERAVEIAQAVKGVRGVVERIDVKPVKRGDDDIESDVIQALIEDPATESFEIRVSVSNGAVTLKGTVQSWQEKQLAGTVAKGVKGVRKVENRIKVIYTEKRSDNEIKADVTQRLEQDVHVDDTLIDVNVRNGHVTLSGTVGSTAEKRRAATDAWVSGVTGVDSEKLKVEWWARDEMRRKKGYVALSDRKIESAVKDAFLYDPRVSMFDVSAEVRNGSVTLTGVVDNLKAKRAAEKDAKNVMGVWRVRNYISVRPDQDIPPAEELERRVEDALMRDPYVERYDLSISSVNGTIYLDGEVNTSFERARAEEVASRVQGVVWVVNNVDYQHAWTWKPDWEIREEVNSQLFWSPFVDSDQVSVSVDNGIVTLNGKVNSWYERQSAEENAFDAGAKDVRNQLTVKSLQSTGPVTSMR